MWHFHRKFLHDLLCECVLVPLFLCSDVAGNESTFLHFAMYTFVISIMHHTVCLLAVRISCYCAIVVHGHAEQTLEHYSKQWRKTSKQTTKYINACLWLKTHQLSEGRLRRWGVSAGMGATVASGWASICVLSLRLSTSTELLAERKER